MPRRTIPPTRHRLILAAVDLMSRKGYGAAGVDELCQRAAAQKGSFYYFFPSKADLALAAVNFQWETTRSEVFEPISQSEGRGLDRLRRLVETLDSRQRGATAAQSPQGSPIGAIGQEMALQDDRIRRAVDAVFDEQCRYLQDWLDEASEERQITPGDYLTRARQVLAVLEGALLLTKVAGDPDRFRELCAVLPLVAGRNSPTGRPAAGTPPELL